MEQYWQEFLSIALVHLLAVASPGPDFAVVLRHSVQFGRRAAIFTSFGIGTAILLHVAYSLLGIAIVIQSTPWLFQLLSYAAAAYLLYIGVMALRAQPGQYHPQQGTEVGRSLSNRKAFILGFLTNGLNPKATLFFLSLFAVVVSPHTPQEIKLLYGGYLATATGAWFCLLSWGLSSAAVRRFIGHQGHWVDRAMGVVLVLLAIQLIVR